MYQFWPFGSQGYDFCTLVLKWVCFYKNPLFYHYREEHQQKPFTMPLTSVWTRTFFAWAVFFPIQTTWYSLENCSFIHLKIIYSYTRDYLKIWKEEFSRVSSHGLKWGNKPPRRKRSKACLKLRQARVSRAQYYFHKPLARSTRACSREGAY